MMLFAIIFLVLLDSFITKPLQIYKNIFYATNFLRINFVFFYSFVFSIVVTPLQNKHLVRDLRLVLYKLIFA